MKSSKYLHGINIILIILFVAWSIAVAVHANFITSFDNLLINQIYHNHTATPLFILRTLTEIGGTTWTIIITVITLLILSLFKYYYAAIF